MTLERIVRPFQTGDISPSKPRPISEATAEQNNVIINPGHAGTVKTFSGSYNLTVTFYFIKKPKEKKSGQGGYDPYAAVKGNPQVDSGGANSEAGLEPAN